MVMQAVPEGLRIAYVEDNPLDRQALIKYVEQHKLPYEFVLLASFQEAMVYLNDPQCDLVLLDYDLTDGYGLELLPHFLHRHIPVVFITGKGSEQIAVSAMRAGAADYLRKDIEHNYLEFLPITITNVMSRTRAERERDQLLRDLQDALKTIHTLRGLIPICTMCKKVRDDTGYWHSVEEYISQHSLAEFSHGYCPSCYEQARRELEEL